MREIEVLDLNLKSYADVYALQKELVSQKKENHGTPDYLILVQHPETYTFGRKYKAPIPDFIKGKAFEIERGGDATYHNPGQLVAYPILLLKEERRDLHKYQRDLEEVVIRTLKEFGINSERIDGATGVWIPETKKKIASLGVAVSSWVTYHGVALNIENDLSGFGKINPCGFEASVMTSVKEERKENTPSFDAIKSCFQKIFLDIFN